MKTTLHDVAGVLSREVELFPCDKELFYCWPESDDEPRCDQEEASARDPEEAASLLEEVVTGIINKIK